MIFKGSNQIIPLKYHDYNDSIPFNYYSRNIYRGTGTDKAFVYPANQYAVYGSIHQEYRKDNGSLADLPVLRRMNGVWAVGGGVTQFKDTSEWFYLNNPSPSYQDVTNSLTWEFAYDSSKGMWGMRSKSDSQGYRSFKVRPYAVLLIHGSITPAKWFMPIYDDRDIEIDLDFNYKYYKYNSYSDSEGDWITDGAISSDQLKIYPDISIGGVSYHICFVLSPVAYRQTKTAWVSGVGKGFLPIPMLAFKNYEFNDKIYYLELGCEYMGSD